MKNLAALILAISIISTAFSDTIINGGPVSGTWTQSGSPYLIMGDIAIDETSLLTIEPGVEVMFQGYYRLLCEGQLLAVGTEEDSIIFTAENTVEGWDGIDFVDLNLNTLDSTKLEYCELSYGKASRYINFVHFRYGGALHFRYSSKVMINHCLISNNFTADVFGTNGANGTNSTSNIFPGGDGATGGYAGSGGGGAIYCYSSSPLIMNNTFCYNRTGNASGGEGGDGGSHHILGWVFFNAYGGDAGDGGYAVSGNGGGICLNNSPAIITGNIITGNFTGNAFGGEGGNGGSADVGVNQTSAYGGDGGNGGGAVAGKGGAIYCKASNALITNNILFNNRTGNGYGDNGGNGGGAYSPYGTEYGGDGGDGGDGQGGEGLAVFNELLGSPSLNNCTITGHVQGIGIGGDGGNGALAGENGTGTDGGFLIFCDSISPLSVSNSILWDNAEDEIQSSGPITYSCLGIAHPGTGNIVADPQFVEVYQGPCFLSQILAGQTQQSPCVDAGCPDSIIISGTTRVDGIQDEGIVDMGFHYPCFEGQPILIPSSDNLQFWAQIFIGNPYPQTLAVTNQGIGSFNYNITVTVDWIQVSPSSGGPIPPSDSLTVSVDISGLAVGTYDGQIIVEAPNAVFSPDTIPVRLWVTEIIELRGELTGLLQGGLQYLIIDDISVPEGDSLIINPGAIFLFNGDYSFDIYGFLNACGTLEDTIKFLPNAGMNPYFVIKFYDVSSDSSRMEYCLITGGSSTVIGNSTGICLDNASPTISHCTISYNNNHGIHMYLSSPIISNCTILNNSTTFKGGGLYCYDSNPIISNCIILGNQAGSSSSNSGAGGGLYFFRCAPVIMNCIIIDNFASNTYNNYFCRGGGIDFQDMYSIEEDAIIENCVITGNYSGCYGGGISGSHLEIKNCTISGNYAYQYGGNIYLQGYSSIINSIVCNADTNNGIHFSNQTLLSVMYCNFYNNTGGDFGGEVPALLGQINNVNFNGDSCDIYHNIFLDPLFYSTTGDSAFFLTENSPCIDAGDPESPLDPDGTIADIGAYYYHHTMGIEDQPGSEIPQQFTLFPNYPNPFNPATQIHFALPKQSTVKIAVYDLLGRQVAVPAEGDFPPGYHTVIWEASGNSSGVYFIRMEADAFQQTRKALLIR